VVGRGISLELAGVGIVCETGSGPNPLALSPGSAGGIACMVPAVAAQRVPKQADPKTSPELRD